MSGGKPPGGTHHGDDRSSTRCAATGAIRPRIRFGAGRIAELPDACAALGIARPLLITDPGLAGHAIGERVLAIARAAGLPVALFADVRPNPTGADVAAGVEALRKGGHDGVIALGGGSALDAAKAIAFMAAQERPIWDFEDRGDNWRRRQRQRPSRRSWRCRPPPAPAPRSGAPP